MKRFDEGTERTTPRTWRAHTLANLAAVTQGAAQPFTKIVPALATPGVDFSAEKWENASSQHPGAVMRRANLLLAILAFASLLPAAPAFANPGIYLYCRFAILPYDGKNPTYLSDVFGPLPPSINHDLTTPQAAIDAFKKFVSEKYNIKGTVGCAANHAEAEVREDLRRDKQTIESKTNDGKAIDTGWKFSL